MKTMFIAVLSAAVVAAWPLTGQSDESSEPSAGAVLWRYEFDNDILAGSDDFFSAGWSLQRHGPDLASWDDQRMTGLSRWIGKSVPGISGADGLRVHKGIGVVQIMQTPEDLSQTELIEDDIPYAGALGVANSWIALNDDRLNAFQVYVGVLGPASFAEQVQIFIHSDMGWGEDPMGWDNQLGNEPLINLNYAMARKIASFGEKEAGFGADIACGGGLGLGNLFTLAQLGVQGRFGWRLPQGFTPVPDVAGRGVIMDPVLGDPLPGRSQFYFSVVARAAAVGYTVLLDGNTFEDSHSVAYDPYLAQLMFGVHFVRGAMGLHATTYQSSNPVEESTKSDLSWGNFSFDYRF